MSPHDTVTLASVSQSTMATPTGPTLLLHLVIVEPISDMEQMSDYHDLGGLLKPSERSFSSVTDMALSTVDTTDDAAARMKLLLRAEIPCL